MRSLEEINESYEAIIGEVGEPTKTRLLASLMSEIEVSYQIPMIKKETYKDANKDVMELYRKISMSRKL